MREKKTHRVIFKSRERKSITTNWMCKIFYKVLKNSPLNSPCELGADWRKAREIWKPYKSRFKNFSPLRSIDFYTNISQIFYMRTGFHGDHPWLTIQIFIPISKSNLSGAPKSRVEILTDHLFGRLIWCWKSADDSNPLKNSPCLTLLTSHSQLVSFCRSIKKWNSEPSKKRSPNWLQGEWINDLCSC